VLVHVSLLGVQLRIRPIGTVCSLITNVENTRSEIECFLGVEAIDAIPFCFSTAFYRSAHLFTHQMSGTDMDLVEALLADSGLVAVVGAGGKKTTLYSLANRAERGVVTATVRIPIFDDEVARVVVTDDPVEALRENDAWPLGLVPEREREDRYRGYDPALVDAMHERGHADAIYVKADGARTRWLKAPNEREPRIPATADTVVPVASAKVVGKPLTEEYVHRPERVAALTGLALGDPIGADDVAAVLASREGGRKGVPSGAKTVPLVNMVDDEGLEAVGRDIAAGIHERAEVPRVVLARMNAHEPLVAVVEP
jgi:probable selenium-dependent hydroxylase accessory protein YqeC